LAEKEHSSYNTYNEKLDYLFNLERAGIKYDLSNIKALLKVLGNPQNSYKIIHVAGTNGKGSVSSMIFSYLVEAGYCSGLYTSPHIVDFRERIICNKRMISRKFIVDFVDKMRPHIKKINPSFFEVTTAMAFDYFRHCRADYAVIETGLGGRLDSTNVVDPVASVITGISVDHVEYLGSTIPGIAKEKAGIIKSGRPVVIGKLSSEAKKVTVQKAKSENSKLYDSWRRIKGSIVSRSESGLTVLLDGKKYFIPEVGDFQLINAKTALSTLKVIFDKTEKPFSPAVLASSLKNITGNSHLHGRFELISKKPKVIIDVSHNLEAIKNLKQNLNYFRYRDLYIVLGMMHDKDYCSCINEISKIDCKVILTRPKYSRAAEPQTMLGCVKKHRGKFTAFDELKEAYSHVMKMLGRTDMLVVTGSFFLAGEFIELFGKRKSG
jgi:dihydrofolate synthase/folylpolyglutamate synthase